jgi:phosphomannomutase
MVQEPKFTISGLRGVWGEDLNEESARRHIEAFAVFLQKRSGKKVILGRDSRKSGPIISAIAIDILTKAGLEVIDIGIAPTPTIIFLIRTMKLDGGIMLTASHNPPEYNGVKFLSEKALYVDADELIEIKTYLGSQPIYNTGGTINEDLSLGTQHVEHVLANIDVDLIKSKNFKVAIDTINGAGYKLGPILLERLGCIVTVINDTPDGNFAHMPEPLAENLTGLAEKVEEINADIGFAQDPDADRLVLCNEKGEIVFEEYTLALSVKSVLQKTPGDVVVNLSTSNTSEDLVNDTGHKLYRTKVGEGNVVEGIIAHNAIIGGEGSGGVIYPTMNLCRDSLVGMALVLELLAKEGKPISEIVSKLPKYELVKTKMPFEGKLTNVIEKVINALPDGKPDIQDGLRIDFPDRSWVQIRASNTEPIIRIWAEAKTRERAQELVDNIKSLL